MLAHTFIHLPGVGPVTERALWESGVTTWSGFSDAPSLPARIAGCRRLLDDALGECEERLAASDAGYFDRCLPGRERWRLYGDFRESAAFLDIETTGLGPSSSELTLVGILDEDGYHAFVKDENLSDLPRAIKEYDLFVTFNGASFDLPFIEHYWGPVFGGKGHIDLMYPLRRLGYRGDLKRIEARLGLGRGSDLAALSGSDAVVMWQMWQDGDAAARETLLRYNAEDVASLPLLADHVYNRMLDRGSAPCGPLDTLARPPLELSYDIGVIKRLTEIRSRWSVA